MANNEEEEFEFRARAEKEAQQKPSPLSRGLGSYMAMMGKEGGYGSNPAGKLFSMVQKPFQQAGEATATGIAQKFPNIPPQIPAGIGTAMQMIPDTAASLSPSGPGAGLQPKPPEGLFRQLESASGGMKGSLSEQFKTPSLMFSKGTGAAKPLYQQATKDLPYEQTIFKGLTKPQDIVDKAVGIIEKSGKLEPQEGFIARKSLDQIKKKLSSDAFDYYRKTFDNAAKANEDIATADPMHRRGMMAESLRQLLPQNKYGGTSAFKTTIGAMGGPFAAPVLSPAVQGAMAGGMGMAARTPPKAIAALLQYLRSRKNNENPNP